jgi:hypothetical protein
MKGRRVAFKLVYQMNWMAVEFPSGQSTLSSGQPEKGKSDRMNSRAIIQGRYGRYGRYEKVKVVLGGLIVRSSNTPCLEYGSK